MPFGIARLCAQLGGRREHDRPRNGPCAQGARGWRGVPPRRRTSSGRPPSRSSATSLRAVAERASRTQDIDLAGGPVVSVGVPQLAADVPALLDSLANMGFLPVPAVRPCAPYPFKVCARRCAWTQPPRGGRRSKPRMIGRFGRRPAGEAPRPFLEGFERGGSSMGVLVNVLAGAVRAHNCGGADAIRRYARQGREGSSSRRPTCLRCCPEERPGDLDRLGCAQDERCRPARACPSHWPASPGPGRIFAIACKRFSVFASQRRCRLNVLQSVNDYVIPQPKFIDPSFF